MDALKKALGGGALSVITALATEYTKLLHTPAFVHIDWDATVDAEAMVWSAGAVILLYLILVLTKANKYVLAGGTAVFVVACGIALAICYGYSEAVPAAHAAVANRMIDSWHTVFLFADVFAVCAGAAFGMFLVA